MGTQAKILDKVRETCSLPSDNALSLKIGITRAAVSEWRAGKKAMPDERIAQLCAMAKLDGGAWLAAIHAERATDSKERALWESVLDRLGPAAAAVGLAFGLALIAAAPNRSEAATTGFSASDAYYVNCGSGRGHPRDGPETTLAR
ncbi:DUF3693 domain-containing protein [Lysobacter sp. D1-1-M9]|uniref:DUF3693 domain-containing protein n=1 Tax=Novilysobacter longmucuonensis TaxID=3098603 RepID=UPI002FC87D29